MLATIRDDTWNVLNIQHITPIRKDGIIQTPPVVAIKILKDPPTWLKVANSFSPQLQLTCTAAEIYQYNSQMVDHMISSFIYDG